MTMQKTIAEVNSLSYEEFGEYFKRIVERTPLVGFSVWSSRPFTSLNHLYTEFANFLDNLPFSGKEGVLRCHPNLAGKLALSNQLSEESNAEQQRAGLLSLSPEELKLITKLNEDYSDKFDFPFVICVRENKKQAILDGLRSRYHNSLHDEVALGIENIKLIMWYRLLNLVCDSESGESKL